ncbi:hypothetical protein FB451DRAFT_1452874 [Mycena latifolia]|nr:hypothetical protein FB451DRAFT_1452874 [Mycena latifolia]
MAANEPKTSLGADDSTLTLQTPESVPKEKGTTDGQRIAPDAHPQSFLSFFPDWLSGPLRSRRAWKVLLRCWVASMVSFIILLPDASLRTIGVTGFFALLTSLLLPPYLPVQLTLFLLSTLVAGLMAGWGIGIGAMRAANAVRDPALIQAAGQQIQASINASAIFQSNPALAQSTAVFSGWFLDVRATAMYGAFLAVGASIFGLMRAYAPKLIFMSIFGTIALDVFCAVGPLFPSKRYTLLNSMAISVRCYMATVVVTTICIFPETMSHAALDTLGAQIARVGALIQMQDAVLTARAPDGTMLSRFKDLRAGLIAAQQQLLATSGFLALEFSYGRWSGADVRSLEAPTVALITRVGCLLNFDRLVGTATSSDAQAGAVDKDSRASDTYLLRQVHTRNAAREAKHGVRPADVLPVLDAATAEMRTASLAALAAVRDTVQVVNTTRWRRDRARDAACTGALDGAAARLRRAVAAFSETGQSAMLTPFLPVLESAGPDAEDPPLRALFIAYMRSIALAESVQELCAHRPAARLWAPTGLRTVWALVAARGDETDGAFGEDTSAPVEKGEEGRYRRDPDSRPPTNLMQKAMHGIHRVYQWTSTAEAVFTLKYVFVSIALWLPAVFKHSAHFYYVEKVIWALIMAQTTLNIYAADQIFNYVTRLIGTLIGLAIGLLAWYAGNGKGTGNPYGAAVAVGVCIIPWLFVRIFAPERFLAGNILGCTTLLSSSGIRGSTDTLSRIGWSVAWKRWALVMVGAAASLILMMFPPKSGRKAVRQRNAASIAALGECYAFLISTWIAKPEPLSTTAPAPWAADFRARLMGLADEMRAIRELTGLARWEGSIRGKWPAAEYARLVDVQGDMIGSLAQLASALGHLEDEWRLTFVHSSKVLNPDFISDVMAAFTLIAQALRTGEPLHHVLPQSLLDRLFYHHGRAGGPAVISGTDGRIDLEGIKSPSYMYYASAMIAVYQLLTALDELHAITKELCGEIPLAGFASWRDEYERSRSLA